MSISLIKLSDGTEIIGDITYTDVSSVTVQCPLLLHYRYFLGGVPSISFSRYMMFAASNLIKIRYEHVIAIVEARKAFADYYADCVDDYYSKIEASIDEELRSTMTQVDKEEALKKLLDSMPVDKAQMN